MYDLLIKGGTVIDPSQDIHGPYDEVHIQHGIIVRRTSRSVQRLVDAAF